MKKGCTLSDVIVTVGIFGVLTALIAPTIQVKLQNKYKIQHNQKQEKVDYDFTR